MADAQDEGHRRCGTCRHFEPSSSWRQGWCRNSLLFEPGQSQSVPQDALFCGNGHGDFWEPLRSPGEGPSETAGHANVKRPSLSPLRLFESPSPFPQLAGATASGSGLRGGAMMFARNAGGNGGGRRPDDVDPDLDDFGDDEDAVEAPTTRGSRRSSGTSGGAGASGGRQRTVQFQSEERYWTEYLRIALPVVGLLLMIGLFWFWAQQLIGDDNSTEPSPTAQPGLVVTPTESIATPTPTEQTQIVQPTAVPTQPAVATQPPATQTTDNQATPPPATGEIAIGGTVITNDDEVNLRPEASTTGDPLSTLSKDTTLTVIDGPVEADGYTWWQVETAEGQTGWVVADFLTPSE